MKTFGVLLVWALSLLGSRVRAEFLEIAASQIVTAATEKGGRPCILVQWELPKDLDRLIIDGAVIAMTVPVEGDEPLQVDAHPMVKSWDAEDVASSDDWTEGEMGYDERLSSPAIVTQENEGKISLDVYLPVRDQVAGTAANHGFILVPAADATSRIRSIDANAPASLADAKLVIAYRTRR